MKSLSHFLTKVPDPRRKQGRRFSLPSFLSMVILGNMSGHFGLQSLSRFFENNQDYFIETFQLSHGVPGYTRTSTLLKEIDFTALNEAFTNWSMQFLEQGDWIHMDGKSMSSTVTNYSNPYQNFHCLVSAFCNRVGLSISSGSYQNKKSSETGTVRDIIKKFKDKGIIITLDALHCQKKQPKPSWSLEMTM